MSKEERLQRDIEQQQPRKRRQSPEPGPSTKKKGLTSFTSEEKQLRPGDKGWVARARVPQPSTKDYVNRPKSTIDVDMSRVSISFDRDDANLISKYQKYPNNKIDE